MGLIFLIFGPSGSGKTTLLEAITKNDDITRVVTATDRTPRATEKNKKDYYFFTPEKFSEKIKKGKFVEHSKYSTGSRYGILHDELKKVNKGNLAAVLDFDGVCKIKNLYGNDRVVSIFVYRGADAVWNEINSRDIPEDEKKKRMERAKNDFLIMGRADYIICNMSGVPELIKSSEEIIKDALSRRKHLKF